MSTLTHVSAAGGPLKTRPRSKLPSKMPMSLPSSLHQLTSWKCMKTLLSTPWLGRWPLVTPTSPPVQSGISLLKGRFTTVWHVTSRSVQNVIKYAVHVAAFETLLTWPRDFGQHAPRLCLWVCCTHMCSHTWKELHIMLRARNAKMKKTVWLSESTVKRPDQHVFYSEFGWILHITLFLLVVHFFPSIRKVLLFFFFLLWQSHGLCIKI